MASENYWKGWDNFLKVKDRDAGLTPRQSEVFLISLRRENCHKNPQEIALEVLEEPNDEPYNKAMTKVYNKFKIPGTGGGKLKRLLQQLEEEYKNSEFVIQSEATAVDLTDVISKLRDRCYELLEHQKSLTTNSLMARDGLSFPLDDLFIKLSLVKRKKTPIQEDITSAEQGSQLYTAKEEEIPYEYQQFLDEVSGDRTTAKGNGKRTVLIGERGAGKTTLLQKIGNELQNKNIIPIWISLRQLGSKPLAQYLLEDWLRDAAQTLDTAPPEWTTALEELLKTGQVCLLLDGVDEMTLKDRSLLQEIGNQLQEGLIKKVQVILTCRINTWEKDALEKYQVYRCLPFEKEAQIEEFIDKFFSQPETNSELGDQLKAELQLENKVRIRDLIKNPLRLCLLCYAWNVDQGKLPDTQAELYQLFVKAFYKLHEQKYPHLKVSVEQQKELEKAMGELAKAAFDNETFRFLLPEDFVTSFMGDSDDENSLFCLAKKVGWLNCVGRLAERPHEDGYAFFHATFQEYFAALAIDDWDFFVPRDHVDRPVSGKRYRIFESQWKETILFWLGSQHIPEIQKEEVIEFLINFNDGCLEQSNYRGFYDFRTYFLVASGLREFKVSNVEFSNEIVIGLLNFSFGCYYPEYQQFRQFPNAIAETARRSLQETDRQIAIKFLKARCNYFEDFKKVYAQNGLVSDQYKYWDWLSQLANASLYKLDDTLTPNELRNAVELKLECEIDLDQHIIVIDFNQSVNELIFKMTNDENELDCYFIACYLLENYSHCEQLAEQKLICLMRSSRNISIRQLAACSLLDLVSKDIRVIEEAIDTLIHLLRNSTNDIRFQIANSLQWKLSSFSIQELKKIIHALKDCLTSSAYEQNLDLYFNCYDILWHCAQHMSYPEFYHAWNSPALITSSETPESLPADITQDLNFSELPTTLKNAIANDIQLNQAIHLVCVDGINFSDPDNPAMDIYIEMIEQNCPERKQGTPETLSHLKTYWRLDLKKLDKKVVLLFYTSKPDHPFSENFLTVLTTFGGAIALISDQTCEDIQCFSPNNTNLIENILKWLK